MSSYRSHLSKKHQNLQLAIQIANEEFRTHKTDSPPDTFSPKYHIKKVNKALQEIKDFEDRYAVLSHRRESLQRLYTQQEKEINTLTDRFYKGVEQRKGVEGLRGRLQAARSRYHKAEKELHDKVTELALWSRLAQPLNTALDRKAILSNLTDLLPLNPSAPEPLNASTPQRLNPSTPQRLNPSAPQPLSPSSPISRSTGQGNIFLLGTISEEGETKITRQKLKHKDTSTPQLCLIDYSPSLSPLSGFRIYSPLSRSKSSLHGLKANTKTLYTFPSGDRLVSLSGGLKNGKIQFIKFSSALGVVVTLGAEDDCEVETVRELALGQRNILVEIVTHFCLADQAFRGVQLVFEGAI